LINFLGFIFLSAQQRRSGYFETLISKRLLTTEGAEDSQRAQNKDGLNIITVYLEFISCGDATAQRLF
jgi:hypothetical protein